MCLFGGQVTRLIKPAKAGFFVELISREDGKNAITPLSGLIPPKTLPTLASMKHISILVHQGAIFGSVEGPRQVLTEVN